MFIAVGPPSFTSSALISIADELPRLLPAALGITTSSSFGLPLRRRRW